MLTQAELKSVLNYDPDTGIFTWAVDRKGPGAKIGARAGSQHKHGYRTIKVNQVTYAEHHLAWLYVHGILPEYVDHIDRDPSNNRITNIRPVSRSQNQQNRLVQSNNKIGVKGVHYNEKFDKYFTTITLNGVVQRANFKDLGEAKAWRASKELELHTHRPQAIS